MRLATLCSGSIVLAILPAMAWGATIYVDDSAPPTGANDGTTWQNAYVDLQDALKNAQPGDEIRIGQGTYTPAPPNGDPAATFLIDKPLTLQGGFAGVGAPDPDANDPNSLPSTLDGDLNGDDVPASGHQFNVNYEENSLHVVTTQSTSATITGVTIRGGSAASTDHNDNSGGGIFCIDSTITISNSIIEENQAFLLAGGVQGAFGETPSVIVMQDCIVRSNRHINATGGIAGVNAGPGSSFTNCRFEQNICPTAGSTTSLFVRAGTVDACEFVNNQASEDAGAVWAIDSVITNSQFIGNSCGVFGGALILQGQCELHNCLFDDNHSGLNGGAIYAWGNTNDFAMLRDCQFIANESSIGGAIYINSAFSASLAKCTFIDNTTYSNNGLNGGAIANDGTLHIHNVDFRNNFSELRGAAVDNTGSFTAVNSLFSGNHTREFGGAVQNSGVASIVNCTLVGNRALTDSAEPSSGAVHNIAPGEITINNSILWDNSAAGQDSQSTQIFVNGGTVAVNHSTVQDWDGTLGGVNNSGKDPQFIDADGIDNIYGTQDDNARLGEKSPAIDAGNNAFLPNDELDLDQDGDTAEQIPFDLDLNPRIVNAIVDQGSYEFGGEPVCTADIAPEGGNGTVDVDDLLLVINNWGATGGNPADITGNGVVDVDDLLAVINAWGPCS